MGYYWLFTRLYTCFEHCQKQSIEVFYKKDVLKEFAKFIGKLLCQSLFYDKAAGLRPATLFIKRNCGKDVFL